MSTDFQQTPVDVPVPGVPNNEGTWNGCRQRPRDRSVRSTSTSPRASRRGFVIVSDDDGPIVQSWFFNPTTGLMEANVNASQIFVADASGDPTPMSLATWLTTPILSRPATRWNTVYDDDTGGNFQARRYGVEIFPNDPADPGIVVNGDALLADQIYGGSGADDLSGNGGNDIIVGRADNDTLNGGAGNDTISGDEGNDRIDGGAGQDTMRGGTGGDTFVISADALGAINDLIVDFNPGQGDQIDLSELLTGISAGTNLETAGYVSVTQVGADAELKVDVDGGGSNDQTVAVLQNYTFNSASEAVKVLFEDNANVKHSDKYMMIGRSTFRAGRPDIDVVRQDR